jgi:hypothetical protein
MSKGSAFTRALTYFRTADLTEATACLQAATEVVASRAPDDVPPKRSYTRRKHNEEAEATPINGEADATLRKGAIA